MMTCHYPANPGSVPDWLKIYFNQPEVLFAAGNLWIKLLSYLAQQRLSSNGNEPTHCTSWGNVHLRRRETFVRHNKIQFIYCSLIIAP